VRAQRPREDPASDAIAAEPVAPDRKKQRRAEAAERARLAGLRKPLQRKLADVEAELQALEAEKQELEAWLVSEDAYAETNKERLLIVLERQGDLSWQLARAESTWLELQGELERIG
jgi:ATP-binding cassette subfamily F protein 3